MKHQWICFVILALSQSLHTGGGERSKYKPSQITVHYLTCVPLQRLILSALKSHGLINLSDNLVFNRHKNILQISIQDTSSFPYLLNMEWIWIMTSKNELNQYYMHNKYNMACAAAIAVLLRVRRPRLPIQCALNNSVGVLHMQ